MISWAEEKGWTENLQLETDAFLNYYLSTGKKRKLWVRTWQNWIQNANTKYKNNGKNKTSTKQTDREILDDAKAFYDSWQE